MARDSRVDSFERRPREDILREAPPRGTRTVAAILPNGRTLWLRVDPQLAPAATASDVAQLAEQSVRWRRAATASQSHTIRRLAETVAADAERMSDARLDGARTLGRRIVVADISIDRTLSKAAEESRSRIARQLRIERDTVRRLGRRDLWDQIVIATSALLFAAYGERGRLFGPNNLALTVSLLVWLVGDEIVDALFGAEGTSPYPLSDTDAWSYIAPIGNLLTGWWLLDDFQHERFIAGLTPVTLEGTAPTIGPGGELVYRYEVEVPLIRQVGPSHFDDFKLFTNVPVVATVGSIRLTPDAPANARVDGLGANADEGTLGLSIVVVGDPPVGPPPLTLGSLDVAWIIDTAKPSTPALTS